MPFAVQTVAMPKSGVFFTCPLDDIRNSHSESLMPRKTDQLPFALTLADPSHNEPQNSVERGIHDSRFERSSLDFYETPAWVTHALLRHVKFRGKIWEPCCGTGAMSQVLIQQGYSTISTDIMDRGYGTSGVDFLKCTAAPVGCRSIVTNPPYGISSFDSKQQKSAPALLSFVRHAINLTASIDGQLALLVRLQWIAGRRAAELMSEARFAAVITLTKRIQWFEKGKDTKTAQHHHAWVVFDQRHPKGKPPALYFAGRSTNANRVRK